MKFAAAHGVKYPTFASWVQKRRRERSQTQPASEALSASLIESLVELDMSARQNQEPEHLAGGCFEGALRIRHASGLLLCVEDARQAKLAAIVLQELTNAQESC